MLNSCSLNRDAPLFQIHHHSSIVPLTDSYARKHLKKVSKILGLSKSITFHDSVVVALLGHSGMGYLCKTSNHREHGCLPVFRDTLIFPLLFPLPFLPLSSHILLFDYSYLAPGTCMQFSPLIRILDLSKTITLFYTPILACKGSDWGRWHPGPSTCRDTHANPGLTVWWI